MAASMLQKATCKLKFARFLINIRRYTIEPPEWLGGVSAIDEHKYDKYYYPECTDTFEQRIAKIKNEKVESQTNIGVEETKKENKRRLREDLLSIAMTNKINKELEQAARLRKLQIPLDEVKKEWLEGSGIKQTKVLADHYGIYRDLFDGSYFLPVVNLNICFDYDDDYVTPVYRGNRIAPKEAKTTPHVNYESPDDSRLWTLLMTNPDGHLTNSKSEYVHWLVGNIPGNDVSKGEPLVEYIQPFPAKGTGFHRYVFVLFEQNEKIDFSSIKIDSKSLTSRTFETNQFFLKHRSQLIPKGLAFFQSQWDETVRNVFHKTFDMGEPVYEYNFPPPYHPPPKKYPHRQPFDRYFDRYRDKKDLAEEVIRKKLQMISPFQRYQPPKYPLAHRPKTYKPSWLILREEMMHRRREQYKDLP